jgi:hypothetical protein
MLEIDTEQLECITALERRRTGLVLAPLLAQLWPAAAERLAERWPAFVMAAQERASGLGLNELADQARFIGLCALRGLNLEWAQDILDDPERRPALKLFQLTVRARQQLAPGGPVSPAQFDTSFAVSDAAIAALGRKRSVFTDRPAPTPAMACDLSQVALAIGTVKPLVLTDPPEEPLELAVLTPTPLKLAAQVLGSCSKHPELIHEGPAGRSVRQGNEALRLAITLPAPPEREPGLTGIAHSPAPELHRFTLNCCGIREAGAAFGAISLAARAYPRTPWRLALQHGPWAGTQWPEPQPQVPAALALELLSDGRALPTQPWQAQWLSLQTQWRAGLEKLFNAWAKALEAPALEDKSRLLDGEAQLAWAWRDMEGQVLMQTAGRLNWTALNLDLRLTGQLRVGDALAELRLQAFGEARWQQEVKPDTPLEELVCSWQFPIALQLLPRIGSAPALIGLRPGPAGAISGKAGLRPRPDGRGWQWFCKVEVEPLVLPLSTLDPLLGERREPKPLLPALTLLDWSAG